MSGERSLRRVAAWLIAGLARLVVGTGKTFGSLAAVTAGGQNATSRVIDARTVEVSFKPNADYGKALTFTLSTTAP
jgi:hypothetical protein